MVVIVLIFFSCKLLWMFSWWFCCGFDPIVRSILNSPPFGGIFLCFFEALFPYANLSFEKHQRWENLATKLRWWMVCYITSKLTYWMMPNASLVRPQCSSAESKTKSTQVVGGEDGGKDCIIIYDMTSENATFYYGKWYFKIQNLLRWTCMKYEDSTIPYHLLIRHAIFHWDGNVTWAVIKSLVGLYRGLEHPVIFRDYDIGMKPTRIFMVHVTYTGFWSLRLHDLKLHKRKPLVFGDQPWINPPRSCLHDLDLLGNGGWQKYSRNGEKNDDLPECAKNHPKQTTIKGLLIPSLSPLQAVVGFWPLRLPWNIYGK